MLAVVAAVHIAALMLVLVEPVVAVLAVAQMVALLLLLALPTEVAVVVGTQNLPAQQAALAS